MGSLFYIFGQAGLLEQDRISIYDAAGRMAAGVLVLGVSTAAVNKFWKDGKEKAHTDPTIQYEHIVKQSIRLYQIRRECQDGNKI